MKTTNNTEPRILAPAADDTLRKKHKKQHIVIIPLLQVHLKIFLTEKFLLKEEK